MNRFFLYIFFILSTVSCESNRNSRAKNITKVVFSTGPCRGGYCPTLSIEVDDNLNYKFFGASDANLHGFYKGKVGQYFLDTLEVKLKNSFYDKIDTTYNYGYEHPVRFEIIIYDNIATKKIKGDWESAPNELKEALNWLKDSYPYIELTKVDTLIFETDLHSIYVK